MKPEEYTSLLKEIRNIKEIVDERAKVTEINIKESVTSEIKTFVGSEIKKLREHFETSEQLQTDFIVTKILGAVAQSEADILMSISTLSRRVQSHEKRITNLEEKTNTPRIDIH